MSERKWFSEMKRFGESFEALDGDRLRHCLNDADLEGEWPQHYQNAILPSSLLQQERYLEGTRSDPGILNLDIPLEFDLVIVDEAHHLRNTDTNLYQGVRHLCNHAKAALFLTATPVQLGGDDLFTLLELLRPDIISDKASFELRAGPNPFFNAAINACRQVNPGWNREAQAQLDHAAETPWGQQFLQTSEPFQEAYDSLYDPDLKDEARVDVIRSLEDQYTFSDLINRTRRRDIGEFTLRRPQTVSIDFTAEQEELHDALLRVVRTCYQEIHGQINLEFMMSTLRRQAASCLHGLAPLMREFLEGRLDRVRMEEEGVTEGLEIPADGFRVSDGLKQEVEEVCLRAEQLGDEDPKAVRFLEVVVEKASQERNKTLVFSTFLHTLDYLSSYLDRKGT